MDANNKREDPRAESDKRLQCFPLTAYVSLQPRRVILMLLLLCFVVFFLIRIRDGGASPMVTAVFSANNRNATIEQRRQLLALSEQSKSSTRPLKILYTMTTLAEYDGGGRSTTKGHDRMQNLLIPVLKEGVESLLQAGHSVDVVLVCYYKMTRPELIRQALPSNVGLNIWDEAAPYSYKVDKMDDPKRKLLHNTLALARQHRFVVKDHLMEYDFFLNFEDDMVIHADHVQNHMDVTQELFRLRESAPETLDKTQRDKHHGPLTKDQLKRMFPGLMRVEVLLDETKHGTQTELDPVPRYDGSPTIDSVPCCHLSASTTSATRPQSPTSDKLFLWETGIRALGVREMPSLLGDTQWVMLQRGPNTRQGGSHFLTKDYWSGTDQYFGKERRPNPKDFDFVNNMGGWMASQQQIWYVRFKQN